VTEIQVKLRSFESKILYFNGLYKLPIAPYPTTRIESTYQEYRKSGTNFVDRLASFKTILSDECNEIDDVKTDSEIDTLVNLADLLGDIVVYCSSEAARYGIPLPEVLSIIMDSNFSKLDAEGKPIYDPDTGKVMKGPFYWKPEPKIKELLLERIAEYKALKGIVHESD